MNTLKDALRYVQQTGYVPWHTPQERDFTEQMQLKNLIEFEPDARPPDRAKYFRAPRGSRYFLTAEGRRLLRPADY